MELNPEDLAKITDFTLSHYNAHAEDFWEGTRDHNVSQNITAAYVRYCFKDPMDAAIFRSRFEAKSEPFRRAG